MSDDDPRPESMLAGFQRKHLRKLAHDLKPIVSVGEGGLSPAVGRALEDALAHHELVKVKLHQPADKKAAAAELARMGRAELCGLVGHTVILYRRNDEKPRIEVPDRPAGG
jgi:RNA-binding protein